MRLSQTRRRRSHGIACGAALLLSLACASSKQAAGTVASSGSASDEPDVELPLEGGSPAASGIDASHPGSVEDRISGVRFYFARVFTPLEEDDDFFPTLCPTGDDCFYSVAVFADGRLVLDDSVGRVTVSLDAEDLERTLLLLRSDELVAAIEKPNMACPGLSADVKAAFSSIWPDGTLMFYSGFEGCLAGEVTGMENHPLFRLRQLVDGDFRPQYMSCPSAPAGDSSLRALCQNFQFIELSAR